MLQRVAWYWDKRGVRGDARESELGMATVLLAQLELEGKVITGDALYCQRKLSLQVTGAGRRLLLGPEGQPAWDEGGGEPALCGAALRRGLCRGHPGEPAWRPVGKAHALGIDGLEPLPGLAGLGTGLLRGTDPVAQGQKDSGPFLRHRQSACRRNGRRLTVCWAYDGDTGG